ncbi:MAG: hypothetical protein KKC39_08005 [Candidatus Omnitrophica bacterium]|nr:hypothetical protein [Candidatus Omnitrophota bacterium]MBU4468661.1 hypothetical protein [Candidatus Omnitrophota bacterium]MCG2707551.1 hypothetical protein [Candidatus Omnitrophota bacterium]
MENKKSDNEEISAIMLLQKIKSGEINPKTLSKEGRQLCVSVLALQEGFTIAQTAQLMCCCEKTIQRDLAEIRKKNSLSPSLELAREIIGELFIKAQVHASQLMRFARSEGPLGERVQAEFLAWRVRKELMEKLQTLGYLPLVAQRVEGEIFHHFEDMDGEKGPLELKKSLDIIEANAKETGTFNAETEEQIRQIKSRIEKGEIELDIDNLNKKQDNNLGGQNEPDTK